MMTLNEAIAHAKSVQCDSEACAKDHAQLAEWLDELKEYRKRYGTLEPKKSLTLEFLQKRAFSHSNDLITSRYPLITKDGTSISIQRGIGLYSQPEIPIREFTTTPFDYDAKHDENVISVEVGLYGNKKIESSSELLMYCTDCEEYQKDPPNDDKLYIFAYVPIEVVDRFIEKHGGFGIIGYEQKV